MRGLDGQWHAEAHGTAQGRLKEEEAKSSRSSVALGLQLLIERVRLQAGAEAAGEAEAEEEHVALAAPTALYTIGYRELLVLWSSGRVLQRPS